MSLAPVLGTYRLTEQQAYSMTLEAINVMGKGAEIDTAQSYGISKEVARAIEDGGRSVKVTTKIMDFSIEGVLEQERLFRSGENDGYIHTLLLHTPIAQDIVQNWEILSRLVANGELRIENVGVSNFEIPHLTRLSATTFGMPTINQIEVNPFLQRRRLLEFHYLHDIATTAHSPLIKAERFEYFRPIADQLGLTPAQVLLSWFAQRDSDVVVQPIPRTSVSRHLLENVMTALAPVQLVKSHLDLIDSFEAMYGQFATHCKYISDYSPRRTPREAPRGTKCVNRKVQGSAN